MSIKQLLQDCDIALIISETCGHCRNLVENMRASLDDDDYAELASRMHKLSTLKRTQQNVDGVPMWISQNKKVAFYGNISKDDLIEKLNAIYVRQ